MFPLYFCCLLLDEAFFIKFEQKIVVTRWKIKELILQLHAVSKTKTIHADFKHLLKCQPCQKYTDKHWIVALQSINENMVPLFHGFM